MKTVKTGIRLKANGHYHVTKSIDGVRYYKVFKSQREAEGWKRNFHPLANPVVDSPVLKSSAATLIGNGRDNSITFREVLEKYKNGKMRNLSTSKQYKKGKRMDRFLPPLLSVLMCNMTPEIITRLLEDAKRTVTNTHGRSSFDEELKDLRSVFNWYKDEVDFFFHSPVMTYHSKVGTVKTIKRSRKDMTEAQISLFFSKLKEPFQSLAVIQFCAAMRIAEAAAVNTNTVDLKAKKLLITDTIVWEKGVPIHYEKTKTGNDASTDINEEMTWRLNELDRKRPKGCIFFFHVNGKPLRYEYILEAYNQALKDAGLDAYSGTHFVRHTMATLTRRKHGRDAAQAVLRHTSPRMTEIYAKLDVNENVSKVVLEAQGMFRSRASNASKGEERLEKLSS